METIALSLRPLSLCIFVFGVVACGGTHDPPPRTPTTSAKAASPEGPAALGYSAKAIDAALDALWKERGIAPSGDCTDAAYMRRAYLDIVGTIPGREATERFLA